MQLSLDLGGLSWAEPVCGGWLSSKGKRWERAEHLPLSRFTRSACMSSKAALSTGHSCNSTNAEAPLSRGQNTTPQRPTLGPSSQAFVHGIDNLVLCSLCQPFLPFRVHPGPQRGLGSFAVVCPLPCAQECTWLASCPPHQTPCPVHESPCFP